MRQYWTEYELALLADLYPEMTCPEVAAMLSRTERSVYSMAQIRGVKKSAEFLASDASGRTTGQRGGKTRFAKGVTPWNKGVAYVAGGRSAETRFKPGTAPPNRQPVGTTRITKDGYIEIKAAEGMRQWRLLHREVWKQEHGEYPAKGKALIFKDDNKQNCNIGNLELLTRAELMARNTVHNYPPEIAKTIQLIGALNRKINAQHRRSS